MTTAWTQVVKEDGVTPATPFDDGSGRVDLNVAGDPGLTFDVTAVDYFGKDPRFMVVYNLYSIPNKDRLRLKAPVEESDTTIDSVIPVWTTANWLERETYDLFGIKFKNHPDLRRILMTEDWVGHPLRKDYPLQGPGREPYKGRLS